LAHGGDRDSNVAATKATRAMGNCGEGNDGNVRQQRQMNVCVVCVCVYKMCGISSGDGHVRRFNLGINSYV
jgi:hypothetical protein